MPNEANKRKYLCDRLMRHTVDVLQAMLQLYLNCAPPKCSKRHLTWLVAGCLLDDADGPAKGKRRKPPPPLLWYALRVERGKEARVRRDARRLVRIKGLTSLVKRVLVPRYRNVELRKDKTGVKRRMVMRRRKFPGYVVVEMRFGPQTRYLFDRLKFTMGFLPAKLKAESEADKANDHYYDPTPVRPEEAELILRQLQETKDKTPYKEVIDAKPGDAIVITDGLFAGESGVVEKVKDGPVVVASVTMLGRKVSVEVRPHQFKKGD